MPTAVHRSLFAWTVLFFAATLRAGIVIPAPATAPSVPVFDRYELVFHVDQAYENPYNPDEVKIDALVTPPSGREQTVPCFWMVPVKDGKRLPGEGAWHLRYAPLESGSHKLVIKLIDKSGASESTPVQFTAIAARDPRGFVRLDKENSQFARFDNGRPYYPIGMNVPVDQAHDSFNWYRYWLSTFNGHGLEWAHSDKAEWQDYEGLGKYSQIAADTLDKALETAERRGIYIQLTLQYHEEVLDGEADDQKFDGVTKWGDPGSPFFKGNGGPLQKAADWHGSPVVREYCKKQYRYIVARWGYSTHILGWELFNETDYSSAARSGKMKDVANWHDEMSKFFKQIDPYKHLVLTSISDPFWTEMYDLMDHLPALDMIQFHIYSNALRERQLPEADKFKRRNKPTWMAEFGVSDNVNKDTEGRHLRRTSWVGMMNACPAMYWDSGYGMKPEFRPIFDHLAAFMRDVDVVKETGGTPTHLDVHCDAPSEAPITIIPTLAGFGSAPASSEFVIRRDGSVENGDQLPRYIYGLDQRDKNKPLRFRMNFESAAKVTFQSKAADAKVPVTIELSVGKAIKKIELRGESMDASIDVPTGLQSLVVKNASPASGELSKITVETRHEPLAAIGYVGKETAMGYIYDTTLDDFSSQPAPAYHNPIIRVPGLSAGTYQAMLVDPKSGVSEVAPVKFDSGVAIISVPSIVADLAFKIRPLHPGKE